MINKDFVRFGGGGETLLTPLGLALLLIAGLLMFALNRKYLVIPLLFAAVFIPLSQRVVIGGLHFTSARMLVACAWIRMLPVALRGRVGLTKIDKAVILWAVSGAVTFTLLWASVDALVNRMGMLYDCFGMYFLLRVLLRDESAVFRAIKAMTVISLCLGFCMLVEHMRGINPFYVFGGVDEFSYVRDGHIRAQGPFAHAILAGCFGATLVPLFAGMWWQKRLRLSSALGILGASAMTFSSFSSTAMLAWGAGLAGLLMWPLRSYMRIFRWAIVLIIVGLHLSMKAPVWALISRIDLAGGSSGYQRFELINQTIVHFREWWLLGEKTTYQWGYNLWDTANTYVETAVTGGLCMLVLLIAIIVLSFQALGKMRKSTSDRKDAKLAWTLGAVLLAHLFAFVGITYYDQTVVGWYLLLAMICAVTAHARPSQSGPARQADLSSLDLELPIDTLSSSHLGTGRPDPQWV